MFLFLFALVLVVIGAWLRSTADDVLQTCGLWLYGFAVIVVVIASSVGCGNPFTEPSCIRTVVQEVKQDTVKCSFVEGRWVCVTVKVYAPGGVQAVCEEEAK